jgi:pyruvate dehydrogenase E2 component (dihydrolipoamide acetyltransferase)
MTPIIIPQLDANVVDVTITQWHKQVGDAVEKGEIIAVLTTDKAAYEFESPASGILLAISAPTKSIVPTGSVMGAIGEQGEDVRTGICTCPSVTQGQQDTRITANTAAFKTYRARATPRARKLALEKGFDLAVICAAEGIEIVDEAAIAAYEQKKGEQ